MESKRKAYVEIDIRKKAFGDLKECEVGLQRISERVEELYGPKEIVNSSDWLVCHKENGQTFKEFLQKPDRNEVTKQRNKIYLLIADEKIDADFQAKLLKYCKAFYTGMEVELMKHSGEEFMKQYNIENRINEFTGMIQYNASKILEKTIPLIPKDAYCMLTVTMHDIYPRPAWNFVFGLADLT